MPLTGQALSALVFADHLSLFPTALNATRENLITGVATHNVPEQFISALCEGYVTALLKMTIFDIGGGTVGVPPGSAVPVPVTFPGGAAAVTQFLVQSAWSGEYSALVAQSFILNVLNNAATLGLLYMKPNPAMGIGTGVVSPASNPNLATLMTAELNTTLPLAFQANGNFGEGDVPGSPTNAALAASLPNYATALGTGTGSMAAQVTYASAAGSTTAIAGVINSGNFA